MVGVGGLIFGWLFKLGISNWCSFIFKFILSISSKGELGILGQKWGWTKGLKSWKWCSGRDLESENITKK